MYINVRRILILLSALFCVSYPIAVIGVAFDVTPPFSFAWAGSALLVLEGVILVLAAILTYGWIRASLATLAVIALTALVEEVGVTLGFPFGTYSYTEVLQPRITPSVPLAVPFAWILVVFGSYGIVRTGYAAWSRIGLRGALFGAALAVSLDLAIEPVATSIERYWLWIHPGALNYYGVPLMNFVAWFMVAWALIVLIDRLIVMPSVDVSRSGVKPTGHLAHLFPPALFGGSLFMFGLINLTHGYYAGVLFAVLAGLAIWFYLIRIPPAASL